MKKIRTVGEEMWIKKCMIKTWCECKKCEDKKCEIKKYSKKCENKKCDIKNMGPKKWQ